MQRSPNNPFIRRFVLFPLMVFSFFAIVIGGGYYFMNQKVVAVSTQNQNLKHNVRDVIQQVQFLRRQRILFLEYGDQYAALMEKGLVQDFDRVKWVDGMIKIRDQLGFSAYTLQFEPEVKLTKSDFQSFNLKKDIFYYTRMNVNMAMSLDTDITELMAKMVYQITPFYMLDRCQIQLLPSRLGQFKFDITQQNFNSRCAFIVFQAKPNAKHKSKTVPGGSS